MSDIRFMRLALRLARKGYGMTSPNPMVGAVLVRNGKMIGRGWHRRAGEPHAEIEAIRDAQKRKTRIDGATLYVTLEPCCTHGRTPPCTDAIITAGISRVVIGTTDPNPRHSGKGFRILRRAGILVDEVGVSRRRNRTIQQTAGGAIATECSRLNEAFNHWIVHRTPFVTVKAALTLDGKIATASGESRWITGEKARAHGMKLRYRADAILVGVNTILADDPRLTFRNGRLETKKRNGPKRLRRIVLDSLARTPLTAKVVSDKDADLTTIVATRRAPKTRVQHLARRVKVLVAPLSKSKFKNQKPKIDLRWLLKKLGQENITSLLVEGGGEVNASFLLGELTQRIAFFYGPKILGGRDSRKAVAGEGARRLRDVLNLRDLELQKLGADLLLTGRIAS